MAWYDGTKPTNRKEPNIMLPEHTEPSTPNPETSTLPSILMRLFLSCELPYRYYVPGRFVVTEKNV